MAIEKVPTELVLMVFSNVDSPTDLRSLILASKHCYQVFSASPKRILKKTVEKIILPEALPHAVAAVQFPESEIIKGTQRKSATVEEFSKTYFESKTLPFPTDNIFDLSRLCAQVEYFVNDYSKRASRELVAFNPLCRDFAVPGFSARSRASSKGTLSVKPLSYDEKVRFQRAFFRYELYCRLFPVSKKEIEKKDGPRFSPDFQFRQFLDHLRPWEAEELSCVFQYLIYTISGLADKIEDEAVMDILAASRRRSPLWAYTSCQGLTSTKDRKESPAPFDRLRNSIARNRDVSYDIDAWEDRVRSECPVCEMGGSCYHDSEDLKLDPRLHEFPRLDRGHHLDLFTGKTHSIMHFGYHAAFGLKYVRNLLMADGDTLNKALGGDYSITRQFLPQALKHAHLSISSSDDLTKCNSGWKDFNAMGYTGFYAQTCNNGLASFALRARAYVFWDDWRISDNAKKFVEARGMTLPRRRSLFDRGQFRSVEERVRGCFLEEKEIERILAKFQCKGAGVLPNSIWFGTK